MYRLSVVYIQFVARTLCLILLKFKLSVFLEVDKLNRRKVAYIESNGYEGPKFSNILNTNLRDF